MTRIRMDWRKLELTATGHAGGGKKGQDIICAGISALTMALLNQLVSENGRGTTYKIDEEAGRLFIRTCPRKENEEKIMDYFQVIITGLRAWEQAFPEYIRMEEVNRDGIA